MPTVKLNGTDIFYEDHGPHSAPTIVFSPLLFLDTSIYAPMVAAFSDEYRVITYDHRGQGQSSRLTKRTNLETTTQDAIDLIEYLRVDPCHFVGNCLGAYVGLNIAVRRSDILKSCTVIGAVAEAEPSQSIRDMDQFFDTMKRDGAKMGMQGFMNMVFGESFRASRDPAVIQRREKIMARLNSLTSAELENAKQIFHRQALTNQELKNITVPVMIIAGDEDQPSNLAAYRRLSEVIPHVTYKTIHHAGYAITLEQPQDLINVIRDFVEKSEREYAARAAQKSKLQKPHVRTR